METVYRDYGALNSRNEYDNQVEITPRRQVYQATHRGDGSRLPLMNRSFISFTYGGRYIEDFDLLASIINNRLTKNGYANFDDTVTTYDNLDGEFYWGTHYKTNQLTFILSTDGIEQKMLDEFMYWFHAGEMKELILMEHPNRAIMARVAAPPELSLLPFEHEVPVKISEHTYMTKTTLYKGDITLQLVMDEPFWYAKTNILGKVATVMIDGKPQQRYVDLWDDPSYDPPKEIDIFASKEALKMLVEDGIPLGSMINNNMLLGNGAYASVEDDTNSLIWDPSESEIVWTYGEPSGEGARIYGEITQTEYATNSRYVLATEPQGNENVCTQILAEDGSEILYDKSPDFVSDYREFHPGFYNGKIAGPIIDKDGKGILALSPFMNGYFFYAGTAPSPTIISFVMPINEDSFTSEGYFKDIFSKFSSTDKLYNSIVVESIHQHELKITTPNLITSYNQTLQYIYQHYHNDMTVPELRDLIIRRIKHPAVRAWANALLSFDNDLLPTGVNTEVIARKMKEFFQNDDGTYPSMRFTFNSKTGEAFGEMSYRKATSQLSLYNFIYEPNATNKVNTIRSEDNSLTDKQRYENLVTWGWEHWCLDTEGQQIIPTDEQPSSYTRAITRFCNLLDYNIKNGISMPGIFTATQSSLEHSILIQVAEDVSDMLYSNNIVITDRNYPKSDTGTIVAWEDTLVGRTYSHRIYHTFPKDIHEVQIYYHTMYL